MIAMSMSYDDAVEMRNLRGEQLLAEIRAAIDEHALALALDQD